MSNFGNCKKTLLFRHDDSYQSIKSCPTSRRETFGGRGCSLRPYTDTAEYEILCQIQHYGGPTNLIDFTRDFLIALFFACNKDAAKRGRVIWTKEHYLPVQLTDVRVQRQKSIFIEAEGGVLSSKGFSHIAIPRQTQRSHIDVP